MVAWEIVNVHSNTKTQLELLKEEWKLNSYNEVIEKLMGLKKDE